MNWMGRVKSCDFAMKWTRRRTNTATKKWSMNEKWFGAMITGPSCGTLSEAMHRARKITKRIGVSTIRTTSYIQSAPFVRVRSWKRSKCSLGRGSL